jgi:divalent metal cation (Fe/Co/Zn/Cd) transporter
VIGASIVIDFFRARILNKVAKETSSEALEADALHFSSDLWSSLAVLIGLAGVAYGIKWADTAAALVVAILVLFAGWRLARRTVDTLLDTAPPGVADQITRIARRVPALSRSSRARATGRAGSVRELNLSVSRTMPIDRVASLKEAVTKAVCAQLPKAQISIVTEPRALDNETILDRVMVIARNRGLAVHHVTVHAIGEKLSVSLDLEVEGSLTLGPPMISPMASKSRSLMSWARMSRWKRISSRCNPTACWAATLPPRASLKFRLPSPNSRAGKECCATFTMSGCAKTSEGEVINFHLQRGSVENRARRPRKGRRSRARAARQMALDQARDRAMRNPYCGRKSRDPCS